MGKTIRQTDIKVRKNWTRSPVQKVKGSDKVHNRKREKQTVKNEIDEAMYGDTF